MFITELDTGITELSQDEYFYLTENLDCADKNDVKTAVRYLVFNKKRKLTEIVRRAMENELSETERNIALDYWGGGLSAYKIADRYSMAKTTVYRNLENAKNKLRKSLEYVLIYDSEALPQSAEELLEFVRAERKIC